MDTEQVYQKTLEYLYGFVDYSLTRSFQFTADKFDLERMREFLEYLGNPQQAYPILHIAGTKGKGSVSTLCANVLRCAEVSRRFIYLTALTGLCRAHQVDGEPITHEALIEWWTKSGLIWTRAPD
jgi:dihydrofolate synthase/folylpolyglutamate synthase